MKKLVKWFHKHAHSIQILTNIFTITGVIVAVFQITSGKEIIQAIYQSQEKNASYRLIAMQTEIQTNLDVIGEVLKRKEMFEKTGQVLQVPLSISVYFSNPTFFKLKHLDKNGNDQLNQAIARTYINWQRANDLIQSSLTLATNSTLDAVSKKMVLANNSARIARIFEDTQATGSEILKAIKDEPGPI